MSATATADVHTLPRPPQRVEVRLVVAEPETLRPDQRQRIDLIAENVLEAAADLIAERVALELRQEVRVDVLPLG